MQAIQDIYAPENKCFGCGPKNELGLQIKSYVEGETLVAHFIPKLHHQAFENILSGGICGTLLDCHSNWCATYFIMKYRKEENAPCTVTARYSVELLMPTPINERLKIIATPVKVSHNKAEINAEIYAGNVCTAKCNGLFVAVAPGHPAYHRW